MHCSEMAEMETENSLNQFKLAVKDDLNCEFPVHQCVFQNNVHKVAALIKSHDISQKDRHGNTALHLAIMLGHKECVQLLLAHGASVKVKNNQGWSPLAEAISYGDRTTITSLLRKLKKQSREAMETRRPDLVRALNLVGDFVMELKWDFQSWLPLVSRLLPSDLCKIYKKGCNIRLDTTLVDFSDMKWERGDVSFVFMGESKPSQSLTVLDNKLKVYQRVRYEESETEIEDEVDILMSSDIVAAQMSTKNISFGRAQSGWLFKEDKTENVGHFMSDFYSVNGLCLESRKRREHLSEDDLQKNRKIIETLTKAPTSGSASVLSNLAPIDEGSLEALPLVERRKSLIPPTRRAQTWEEYISCPSGKYPSLGRDIVCKESTKAFKATLAMSQDFPLTVDALLNVLEVIAPFKHFSKLREFVEVKLPPGFPVKIEIPILPTVTARITFHDFRFDDKLPESLFEIPVGYNENPSRFADL
ncbi:Ankyrin repeat domain-containing protein 13C [Halotydeus destructor]|nr:Ankyrin repeat domain-containing protein 13C [Halotydeus destructor]